MRWRVAPRPKISPIEGGRASETDILHDGAGKQERVLGNQPGLGVERFLGHVTHIHPVNFYTSGGDIVKSQNQFGDGAFPRPGRADERDRLPWLNRQADIVQDFGGIFPIAERDPSNSTRPRIGGMIPAVRVYRLRSAQC